MRHKIESPALECSTSREGSSLRGTLVWVSPFADIPTDQLAAEAAWV